MIKLKPERDCDEDTCCVRGCHLPSECSLCGQAAAAYKRDRVGFCDRHWLEYCDDDGGVEDLFVPTKR